MQTNVRAGKARRLREGLAAGRTLWSASAYDALSAKLIEEAGFDLVQTAGFVISAAAWGLPDAELYTMTENRDVVRACANAVSLPLIADVDTGYGNAINVMRTVREFEQAGVSGVAIEDQLSPKRCPGMVDVEIVPFDEAVGKIRAAVAARNDPDFVIVARTDARDIDEVVRRGKAFAAAGADMFQIISGHRTGDFESIRHIRREVGLPLKMHVTGWLEDVDREDIESVAGIAGFAHAPLYTVISALRTNLAALRSTKTARGLPIAPIAKADFRTFIGFPEIEALQREYMPSAGPADR